MKLLPLNINAFFLSVFAVSGNTTLAETANGEQLFLDNCAACHQDDGKGIENIFPALSGSEVINGSAADIIGILEAGRGDMPSFSGSFSASELSELINYLRHAWDNAQESSTGELISVEQVSELLKRLSLEQ